MEIEFPIEFLVRGVPVSLQAKSARARQEWRAAVREASSTALPAPHLASTSRLSITLFYLPPDEMQGDLDNIIKPILDALSRHVYIDDTQVERLVAQKFEPGRLFSFRRPSTKFAEALTTERPVLYIKVTDDPHEELT